ncbi:MAG: glycosyltransferase family 4 protein [Planctomycetes bacterium]|nr:glycosyltransferase family 4 protein [Planctomycetota bacterium]
MRVALVTPEFPGCGPSYGVGQYGSALARGLAERGAEVLVLTADGGGGHAIAPGEPPRRDATWSCPAVLTPLRAAPWLTSSLERWQPEVVEFANWGGLGAWVRGPWTTVVRLSTSVHAIRPGSPLRRAAQQLHFASEARTVAKARRLIAHSGAMAVLGQRLYRRRTDYVIPLPWSGQRLVADVLSDDVLFVGRLEHRKGIDVLLAAWRLVRRQDRRAQLHLVGADHDGFGARALSIWGSDGVVVHGRLEEPDLMALRARCRIQVVPSRYESFGLTALEAWGAGLAVVASDTGGLSEVVDDAGLLVPPGDARALSTAILRLLADRRLCAKLAEQGVERLPLHTVQRCAELTLAAYASARTRGI